MEIKVAQAKAEEEIAKAQKKAEEEKLRSTTIVSTSIEADRKVIEAEGYKKKVETEATADANAELIRAKAKAEAIRLQKLADAEGDLKLAEVRAANIAAETENIANLKRAGLGDGAIVQWAMREEYKNIAAAQADLVSHLNLGQVTVVGGSGEAGGFILDIVKKVQELSALKDMIPGVTGTIGKLENFDKENSEKK
jgi:flotillin